MQTPITDTDQQDQQYSPEDYGAKDYADGDDEEAGEAGAGADAEVKKEVEVMKQKDEEERTVVLTPRRTLDVVGGAGKSDDEDADSSHLGDSQQEQASRLVKRIEELEHQHR